MKISRSTPHIVVPSIVSPHSDAGPVPTVGRRTGAATTTHTHFIPFPDPPSLSTPDPVVPDLIGTHGGAQDGRGNHHPHTFHPLPRSVIPVYP